MEKKGFAAILNTEPIPPYSAEDISIPPYSAEDISSNRSIISQITQDSSNYNSHIKQLDADENTNGSLLNLKNNAQTENSELLQSIANLSSISKIIGIYELVTILLIIGAGFGWYVRDCTE